MVAACFGLSTRTAPSIGVWPTVLRVHIDYRLLVSKVVRYGLNEIVAAMEIGNLLPDLKWHTWPEEVLPSLYQNLTLEQTRAMSSPMLMSLRIDEDWAYKISKNGLLCGVRY